MGEPPRRAAAERHLALETTEPTSFGYGFISGLLSAILGIAGFGPCSASHFPQYLTHARTAPVLFARLSARGHSRHARRVVPARQRQRLSPREQGAGADRHRLHARSRAARRVAGAGRRATPGSGSWLGARLLRAQPAALLGGLHSARAAVRAAGGPAGLPPAVAGRPDLLLRQLAADRGADDPHARARR